MEPAHAEPASPARPEPAAGHGRGHRLLPVALAVVLAGLPPAPAPATAVGHRVAAPAATPAGGAARVVTRWSAASSAGQAAVPVQDPGAGRVPALRMPVAGALVRGFELPAGPYGPGHRGLDIAVPVGERARAPTAGRVTFAGPVAGTNWVSLEVAPGVVVTLGPLLDRVGATSHPVGTDVPPARATTGRPSGATAPPGPVGAGAPLGPGGVGDPLGQVATGQQVPAGAPLGRVAAGHGPARGGSLAPAGRGAATLHLSLRVDGEYVDPLPYLVDRPRPRLAPLLAPGGLPPP